MPSFLIVRLQISEIKHRQTDRQTDKPKPASIDINHIVGVSVCLSVCLSAFNLRYLKSHDHETWHAGPLSDLDVHGPIGILIYGRVAPQATINHAAGVFPLYYQ